MNISQIYKSSTVKLISASPSPELDARILIDFVVGKESLLLSHPKMPLTNAQYSRIRRLITRRKKGEPIAYITGHKEFYGLDFFVNKNVLIPRPESEELVSLALQRIKNNELRIKHDKNKTIIHNSKFNILDLGTGSGCMIISLVSRLRQTFHPLPSTFYFFASDISQAALRVARKNAKKLLFDSPSGVENHAQFSTSSNSIKFVRSDLFQNRLLHRKFDLIITNLPYVPLSDCHLEPFDCAQGRQGVERSHEISPTSLKARGRNDNSVSFEPKNAIFANDNGASIIKRFLEEARNRLTPDGAILLELDPRNAKQIKSFAKKLYPTAKIELKKDLAGLERYLKIRL